jgi:hypothetical protein
MSSYQNGRVPSALLGSVSVKEILYKSEESDMTYQFDTMGVGDSTKLIEVRICLAPTTEILEKVYMANKSFRNTTKSNIRLYTSDDKYIIETARNKKEIDTGLDGYYYGNVLEFKKKNEITGKSGNLGYIFTLYMNPHIYKFSNVLVMMKDLFDINE